jgi:phage tail P2-like protein
MPDLLPINATPQERALSLAVDRLPDAPIKTLWSPQTCPEAQLPWLAWALSVDEWDAAWPVETKRQIIAASIDQHRKKGTVGALRRALQRLGYEVEIDERTGTAYTFRLRVRVSEGESAGGSVAEDALNRAVSIALRQKNARSALIDTAYLAAPDPAGLFAGGVTLCGLHYEAKQMDDYVPQPSGLAVEQTGVSLLGASWSGSADYYRFEIRLQSDGSLVGGGVSYLTSVAHVSILAGQFIFYVCSADLSAWISQAIEIVVVPPSDIAVDTSTPGTINATWTNLEYAAEVQICAAGNGWASTPTGAGLSWGVSSGIIVGLSPGFYDLRVRAQGTAYPGTTAFSTWTEYLNIEVT